MKLRVWLVFLVLLTSGLIRAESAQVKITPMPLHPIVERHGDIYQINVDLVTQNRSSQTLRIAELEARFFDRQGDLISFRTVNKDAFAPSIAVLGQTSLRPGETLDVFNPFATVDVGSEPFQARFSYCFQIENTQKQHDHNQHRDIGDCDETESTTVTFRQYQNRATFAFPLRGPVLVWEGHDFYAHHVRVPLGQPRVQAKEIVANSNEFASDFVYIDKMGAMYSGDSTKLTNWFSYGKTIYAPADGTVVASENDLPENRFAHPHDVRQPELKGRDPKGLGNFVLIDHGDGEYSLLLHMQPGSVLVKKGERVAMGQSIGRIGFSGDAIFPHLHYCLMDGPEVSRSWGLPVYFHGLRHVVGDSIGPSTTDTVNSGDIVETTAP
jgi:hypothetical protein